MTRRALLGLAGAAAGAGVLGAAACERPVAAPAPADDALLVAQLPGGLAVLGSRAQTRLDSPALPGTPVAVATPGLLC
ncbi:MAG TPA: hypothetical protein VES42_03030, partial [Pilimelia sp.]|nr:hypothetical protein [Pilimelia sp.]